MEKINGKDTIDKVAFLLSSIVCRIRDNQLAKDSNPRLSIDAPEKCAESSKMMTAHKTDESPTE